MNESQFINNSLKFPLHCGDMSSIHRHRSRQRSRTGGNKENSFDSENVPSSNLTSAKLDALSNNSKFDEVVDEEVASNVTAESRYSRRSTVSRSSTRKSGKHTTTMNILGKQLQAAMESSAHEINDSNGNGKNGEFSSILEEEVTTVPSSSTHSHISRAKSPIKSPIRSLQNAATNPRRGQSLVAPSHGNNSSSSISNRNYSQQQQESQTKCAVKSNSPSLFTRASNNLRRISSKSAIKETNVVKGTAAVDNQNLKSSSNQTPATAVVVALTAAQNRTLAVANSNSNVNVNASSSTGSFNKSKVNTSVSDFYHETVPSNHIGNSNNPKKSNLIALSKLPSMGSGGTDLQVFELTDSHLLFVGRRSILYARREYGLGDTPNPDSPTSTDSNPNTDTEVEELARVIHQVTLKELFDVKTVRSLNGHTTLELILRAAPGNNIKNNGNDEPTVYSLPMPPADGSTRDSNASGDTLTAQIHALISKNLSAYRRAAEAKRLGRKLMTGRSRRGGSTGSVASNMSCTEAGEFDQFEYTGAGAEYWADPTAPESASTSLDTSGHNSEQTQQLELISIPLTAEKLKSRDRAYKKAAQMQQQEHVQAQAQTQSYQYQLESYNYGQPFRSPSNAAVPVGATVTNSAPEGELKSELLAEISTESAVPVSLLVPVVVEVDEAKTSIATTVVASTHNETATVAPLVVPPVVTAPTEATLSTTSTSATFVDPTAPPSAPAPVPPPLTTTTVVAAASSTGVTGATGVTVLSRARVADAYLNSVTSANAKTNANKTCLSNSSLNNNINNTASSSTNKSSSSHGAVLLPTDKCATSLVPASTIDAIAPTETYVTSTASKTEIETSDNATSIIISSDDNSTNTTNTTSTPTITAARADNDKGKNDTTITTSNPNSGFSLFIRYALVSSLSVLFTGGCVFLAVWHRVLTPQQRIELWPTRFGLREVHGLFGGWLSTTMKTLFPVMGSNKSNSDR